MTMKRLDIKITVELDDALEEVRKVTKRSRTHTVHDGIALLHWAKDVHSRGNTVGEVDSTGETVTVFYMAMFEGLKATFEKAAAMERAADSVVTIEVPMADVSHEYNEVAELAPSSKDAALEDYLKELREGTPEKSVAEAIIEAREEQKGLVVEAVRGLSMLS